MYLLLIEVWLKSKALLKARSLDQPWQLFSTYFLPTAGFAKIPRISWRQTVTRSCHVTLMMTWSTFLSRLWQVPVWATLRLNITLLSINFSLRVFSFCYSWKIKPSKVWQKINTSTWTQTCSHFWGPWRTWSLLSQLNRLYEATLIPLELSVSQTWILFVRGTNSLSKRTARFLQCSMCFKL